MSTDTTPGPAPDARFYLPELDGLRFFAFLAVYVHHHPLLAGTALEPLHTEGWIGVDLFFALSAFLFTTLLRRESDQAGRIDPGKFYLRRILRIWPAYFSYVGFCLACGHILRHPAPAWRVAGLLGFGDDIASGFHGYNPLPFASHLWSICFEEQFYLAIPPAVWIWSRFPSRARPWLLALLAAAGSASKVSAPGFSPLASWTLPWIHFDSVVLGAVLAFGRIDRFWKSLPTWAPLVATPVLFGLVCLLPSADVVSWLLPVKYLAAGLASVSAIQAAVAHRASRRFLSHPVLVRLGRRSYGLYLWHLAAIHAASIALARLPGPARPFGSFVLGLFLAWLVAEVSYRFLETPFLKLKARFEIVRSRPV